MIRSRRWISLLFFILYLPFLIIYARFIYRRIQAYIRLSLEDSETLFNLDLFSESNLAFHLSGSVAWVCLLIMARYWYANKNLDPLFLLFASACAFMGIFPWIHTIFTQEYGFLLIPIILWAMYLVYWHIFNQQHVRPQRKYE